MKKNQRLVFISIYCALSLVLDYIKSFIPFLNMPSGGSINIALIPIVIASFHLGVGSGIASGLLWWLISSLLGLNNQFISIQQYIFDYVIPSGIVGISSMFYKKHNVFEIELGIIIMMIIRTICLIISGAVFWTEGMASGSLEAYGFSFAYNFPYSLATLVMLLIVVPMLLRSMKKYML